MTKIGTLLTEKSIESAIREIKDWLSKIGVNGLETDIRYDPKANVAMIRFRYKGQEYEFISRKQKNCRLNMWGVARVIEWRVRGQLMDVEDIGDSMYRYRLEIEGKVEEQQKPGNVNEIYYVRLGVSPTASNDEIKKAYEKLIKTYHPDVIVNSREAREEFEKRAKEVNEAYSAIKKERGIV